MRRIKRYVPSETLKTIYNSLIQPHLYYCILAWGFSNSRIQKLQKRAIRIISGVKYNAHTDPLFKRLSVLKVQDIFTLQCAKFFFKFKNDKLPVYFGNFFENNNAIHDHNTRYNNDLHLFHFRTETSRNCI